MQINQIFYGKTRLKATRLLSHFVKFRAVKKHTHDTFFHEPVFGCFLDYDAKYEMNQSRLGPRAAMLLFILIGR